MSTRSHSPLCSAATHPAKIFWVQLVELRIGNELDCARESRDRTIGELGVGELRRQRLAFDQRDRDGVAQTHLRVERRAWDIIEAALHVDDFGGTDSHAPFGVPRRAEFFAQRECRIDIGVRAAAARVRFDRSLIEVIYRAQVLVSGAASEASENAFSTPPSANS